MITIESQANIFKSVLTKTGIILTEQEFDNLLKYRMWRINNGLLATTKNKDILAGEEINKKINEKL